MAPDGSWLQVNEALCRMLGYTAEELYARSFQDITHPDDLDLDLAHVEQVLSGAIRSYQLDKRYFHADGREVWATLSVALVRDDDGSPLYFISQVMDIGDRKRREAELQRLADHDPLTGLHNRRSFVRELERERLLSVRHGAPSAVLLLDLDGFKAINDTYGHACGDDVLQAVADRLRDPGAPQRRGRPPGRRRVRPAARPRHRGAGRRGGARRSSTSWRAIAIERAPGLGGIRASVGVASVEAGDGSEDVLVAADEAMYAQKRTR